MVARHNYKRDSWQGKSSTESWHRDSRTANFHHMQFAHNRQHVKKRISDVRWCRRDHSTDQVLELSANCFEVIEHMARGHFGPLQPLMRLNFPHVVSYITISFNLQAAVTKKNCARHVVSMYKKIVWISTSTTSPDEVRRGAGMYNKPVWQVSGNLIIRKDWHGWRSRKCRRLPSPSTPPNRPNRCPRLP